MTNELANRVEAAGGADRELDAAIAVACRFFPKDVGFVWRHELRANSPEVGRVECCTSLGTGGPHYAAPKFTASIDAALTLVRPEWLVTLTGPAGKTYSANINGEVGLARSFALAILSAALRARAQETTND